LNALQRPDEMIGEGLDGRVADGQPAAVFADVVGDRVQQVRLAEPGRAADEERVVGQPGHLGDGQGGTVGEAVAVADHELVERQPRVEFLGGRGALCLGSGARRRLGLLGPDDLDARALAEDGLGARSKQTTEAGLDPGPDVVGRVENQRRAGELAEADALEPDVPGRLAHRVSRLRTETVPDGRWIGL
jgi:hypothetical protein